MPINMGGRRCEGKRDPLNSVSEESKAVTRRLVEELFNTGNLEVADEVLAADYVGHSPSHPDLPGPENLKRAVGEWRIAFPDTHNVIEDMVAEGDKVAVCLTARHTPGRVHGHRRNRQQDSGNELRHLPLVRGQDHGQLGHLQRPGDGAAVQQLGITSLSDT